MNNKARRGAPKKDNKFTHKFIFCVDEETHNYLLQRPEGGSAYLRKLVELDLRDMLVVNVFEL